MRIGIDLSLLSGRPRTGVERYALRLAEALARLEGVEVLRLGEERSGRFRRAFWRRVSMPREARRAGLDLVHVPVSLVPRATSRVRTPLIVRTVHDLGRLRGEASTLAARRERRRLARPIPTVVPSGATRRDLERLVPEFEGPLATIPHGLEPEFLAAARPPRPEGLDLPDRYALVLGTVRDRRRQRVVEEAFDRSAPLPCLWAGRGGAGRVGSLRYLGYVPDPVRLGLLAHATCLLSPSSLEGFGLPALEAAALGTPVLSAPCEAVEETLGGALWSGSFSEPSALRALVGAFLDAPASEIAARSAEARRRVSDLTWERSARAHLDFFRSLLDQSSGR